jgi:hypothetical protein
MQSSGLGAFRPTSDTIRQAPQPDRIAGYSPTQPAGNVTMLRQVAQEVRDIADDIDPDQQEDQNRGPQPDYLRGDFNANLAESIAPDDLAFIANQLLQGIDADLQSRKDWEKIVEKAMEYLGLKFQDATGQVSPGGGVSNVWNTLMLEACLQFWAQAYAEMLPADGPVKIRDDDVPQQPQQRGMGDNGGPPLEGEKTDRDIRAEALETLMNHYLLTTDRQYYPDFSRMLWALGPIGTQFRKVYYNPLRRMAVSEWVKAENLIVSNDAADLSTAQRVTERIPTSQADAKRLQLMGYWLNVPLTMPTSQPTGVEQAIGEIEGIKPGETLPWDYRHTIYECSAEFDLPNFEHTDDDDSRTGLPLPYRFTLDKDSRRIVRICRNWREGDENFEARQRYVMFGLIPGFGFYSMGYVHILGDTQRATTSLEREIIDSAMYATFPAFLNAKGALSRDTTQLKPPPGGSVEVNLGMAKSLQDVVMSIPYKEPSAQVMALLQGLTEQGRKLAQSIEIPVGEGTANIPVGTMIAMIEEGTKLTAAVHKGMHISRTIEFELLKELFAEQPELLTKFYRKAPPFQFQAAEELDDLDLVPASDPNTPSHIHRIMRAVALGQLAQLFPGRVNVDEVIERILRAIREPNPEELLMPPPDPNAPQQPTPQEASAKAKVATAMITAQSRAAESVAKLQGQAADRASKERVAAIESQDDRVQAMAKAQSDYARMHDSAADRAVDIEMQSREHAQNAAERSADRAHDLVQMGQEHAHDIAQQQREHLHQQQTGREDRAHEAQQNALAPPPRKI